MSSDPRTDSTTLIRGPLAAAELAIGSTLNNRYLIERELKRGGIGIVYIARDRQLHSRPVVIKILLEDSYRNAYVVQKFRQEVEALSRLDHPGVVGIIDSGELNDAKPFIVMQYIEGVTLRSVIKPEGIALARCGEIIRQMGRALTAAHEKGIFHRDLKPENVMLQDFGHGEEQIKIIDFGIAKISNSVVAPTTETNVSAGTVSYMAPEQLSGGSVSAATDVYALGEIAYELVTGRKPFNPETGFQLLELQRAGVCVGPADLRASLPAAAQAAILRALEFDPADRYAKAKDFGDELARAIGESHSTSNRQSFQALEPAPTQPATELTPPMQSSAFQAERTVIATFPVIQSKSGESQDVIQPRLTSSRNRFSLLVLSAILVITAIIGGSYWYTRGRATSSAVVSSKPEDERHLSYSLTVQKMRDGKPYQEQFDSTGLEIFENGWKFRMNISSPEAGYLYLLNEGPDADQQTTFNILFPAPSSNSSSRVSANERIQTGWMVFDEHQGTEKFWIVWSAEALPQFEAVRAVVNEQDKGMIREDAQSKAVSDFLVQHSSPTPQLETDKSTKQTMAHISGAILVNAIELEHH